MSKRSQLLKTMKREREYDREFIAKGEKLDICIDALDRQVAKEHKNYRCPKCDTWNKVWILREQTILKYNLENKAEAVFCWHCGQKVRIGEE